MKKGILGIIFTLLLSASVIMLVGSIMSGCEQAKKELKHAKSSTIGIKRVVTLYGCDGKIIKTYKGRFMVEMNGSVATFIDNGKEVKIAGTYTVEEE